MKCICFCEKKVSHVLQLYLRSGAAHFLNALDRPLLLVGKRRTLDTNSFFKKNACFFFFSGMLQVKQRELKECCQSLVTAISLTQQEQIETCLTYRLFAVGQLHQRYRRLRLFFAQLVCRVAARSHQTRHLCGVDSDAAERVKMLGACLMLGAVEEACLRWRAVQNERQLMEGLDREVSRGSFGGRRGRGARTLFIYFRLCFSSVPAGRDVAIV